MKNIWTEAAKDILKGFKYRKNSIECMKKLLEGSKDTEIEARLSETVSKVESAEYALSVLSQDEFFLLNEFYIDRKPGFMERLCKKFSCERSTVYRLKTNALNAFCMTLFGSDE